ncbi:MAG: hypothetical protein ACI8WT_003777 [Clostridium sp.]|jgi:hypothetical protein
MRKGKLSLFVMALTLSVGVSSGVYACEQNKDTNTVKPTSVTQKINFKNAKTKEWDAKFVKNHEDNEKFSASKVASKDAKNKEWAKKYTENHKNHENEVECEDIKVPLTAEQKELTAEQKAVIQDKKDALVPVKEANKVLKTTIIKNAEAVKVELKRIEDSKIVLEPAVKTEVDSVLLEVTDVTTKKDHVKPLVTPVCDVVAPVVPVVDPTVAPVDKTYFERISERLDNKFLRYTEKNTQLTDLANRLLTLLNSLTLIK